jgi:hypothetical protein
MPACTPIFPPGHRIAGILLLCGGNACEHLIGEHLSISSPNDAFSAVVCKLVQNQIAPLKAASLIEQI